jgi:hypothetical protein
MCLTGDIHGDLIFESREGLTKETLLTGLYLNPEGIRLTEDLECGTLTQTQWNEAAAALLGIPSDNLVGFAAVHAVDPARTIATLEALLGIQLTDNGPDRVTN